MYTVKKIRFFSFFFKKKKTQNDTMIYMHSVQNESLCRYIVILLCIVYKILTTIFFLIYIWIKNSWSRGHMWPCVLIHVSNQPRVFMHVSTWPRVKNTGVHMDTCINTRGWMDTCINTHGHMDVCINTRVQSDTCIFYTCQDSRVDLLHAAIWPPVIKTRGHLFPYTTCHVVIKTRGQFPVWLQ